MQPFSSPGSAEHRLTFNQVEGPKFESQLPQDPNQPKTYEQLQSSALNKTQQGLGGIRGFFNRFFGSFFNANTNLIARQNVQAPSQLRAFSNKNQYRSIGRLDTRVVDSRRQPSLNTNQNASLSRAEPEKKIQTPIYQAVTPEVSIGSAIVQEEKVTQPALKKEVPVVEEKKVTTPVPEPKPVEKKTVVPEAKKTPEAPAIDEQEVKERKEAMEILSGALQKINKATERTAASIVDVKGSDPTLKVTFKDGRAFTISVMMEGEKEINILWTVNGKEEKAHFSDRGSRDAHAAEIAKIALAELSNAEKAESIPPLRSQPAEQGSPLRFEFPPDRDLQILEYLGKLAEVGPNQTKQLDECTVVRSGKNVTITFNANATIGEYTLREAGVQKEAKIDVGLSKDHADAVRLKMSEYKKKGVDELKKDLGSQGLVVKEGLEPDTVRGEHPISILNQSGQELVTLSLRAGHSTRGQFDSIGITAEGVYSPCVRLDQFPADLSKMAQYALLGKIGAKEGTDVLSLQNKTAQQGGSVEFGIGTNEPMGLLEYLGEPALIKAGESASLPQCAITRSGNKVSINFKDTATCGEYRLRVAGKNLTIKVGLSDKHAQEIRTQLNSHTNDAVALLNQELKSDGVSVVRGPDPTDVLGEHPLIIKRSGSDVLMVTVRPGHDGHGKFDSLGISVGDMYKTCLDMKQFPVELGILVKAGLKKAPSVMWPAGSEYAKNGPAVAFNVPMNVPLTIQGKDKDGNALGVPDVIDLRTVNEASPLTKLGSVESAAWYTLTRQRDGVEIAFKNGCPPSLELSAPGAGSKILKIN